MSSSPVFTLKLPLELAPTMNAYACMTGRQRAKIRRKVDHVILLETQRQKGWSMGVKRKTKGAVKSQRMVTITMISGGHQRKVRLTRHSSREPDELSVDVMGGKIPVDRLVHAGVLREDDRIWLQREARWTPAPPSKGHVLIEVFDALSSSTSPPSSEPQA